MPEPREGGPVAVRAVLVDPVTLTVTWLNEAAATPLPGHEAAPATGSPLAEVVPMAESLGVAEAVREVAATGEARHLRTGLVSTVRGRVAVAVSAYRLPDGMVLVLVGSAWERAGREQGRSSHSRRQERPQR